MPMWAQATLWGGLAGGALILGALIGYLFNLSQRVVAGIMAFGSGALISVLSFEMIWKAYEKGSLFSTATGFILGAVTYSFANLIVSKHGAKHRKRSNLNNNVNMDKTYENASAIAVGALIDGIPESIVIGLGMVAGGAVSLVTVAAVFASNVPEGLSSSAGMKNSGKKLTYVMTIWVSIAVISAISACAGYLFFKNASAETISLILAISAGAILSMIVDTMIPEAFEETHNFAGFITVIGFLFAFILDKI